MKNQLLSAAVLASALIPAPAMAGILGTGIASTSGQLEVIEQPTGLIPESANILTFAEQTSVSFPGDGVTLNQGEIATGTLVDSFFLSFNPENLHKRQKASGTIEFEREILGLVYSNPVLRSSDRIFGAPGASYQDGGTIDEYELENSFLATGTTSLSFSAMSRHGKDHVRVFTASAADPVSSAAVPTPSTVLGSVLAMGGLIFLIRSTKKEQGTS